jgi:dipeptidyl aminopeptidase/acylaminoacyl peptidase
MRKFTRLVSLALFLIILCERAQAQHVPSFEEVISLRTIGSAIISPEGSSVLFTVQTTDWQENRYDNEIWISQNNQEPFQLTYTSKGSSTSPAFSPDGKWIAFLANRGSKTQIQVIRRAGGEAFPVTNEDEEISAFEWTPDSRSLIFLRSEKESQARKDREKKYGSFEFDDQDFRQSHLWKIDFKPGIRNSVELPCVDQDDTQKNKANCIELPKAVRLTEGNYTVTAFRISPDGTMVAINHQPDPLINSSLHSDISILSLKDMKQTILVSNPSHDGLESWSPDSKEVLFTTNLTDTLQNFYKNSLLFSVSVESGAVRQLASGLDEDLGGFTWEATGIYSTVWNKTTRYLFRVDPLTGNFNKIELPQSLIFSTTFSADGKKVAYVGRTGDELAELFVGEIEGLKFSEPVKLTSFTGQIFGWKTATSEVVAWKSKDGKIIEGVLHKPKDFDPKKKYPLLVMIHGGPTGIDTPTPVPGYVYPVLQWLDKGCIVLRPNYRGSAGYGEGFRALNVRNLGVGDMWDVMSGIDYLDSKGIIDRSRMGSMGWSQGGYISAFLTTNTDQFKAISVGAGISNWTTYYVNTDIHPFTRQYLKATPWSDPGIYNRTSPITNINRARTPTLIQHGELDKRVPIANAYELLQGLRDKGVPADLVVYKGFGHGINKPKERLAATVHNWNWFNKYVWNEKGE